MKAVWREALKLVLLPVAVAVAVAAALGATILALDSTAPNMAQKLFGGLLGIGVGQQLAQPLQGAADQVSEAVETLRGVATEVAS